MGMVADQEPLLLSVDTGETDISKAIAFQNILEGEQV